MSCAFCGAYSDALNLRHMPSGATYRACVDCLEARRGAEVTFQRTPWQAFYRSPQEGFKSFFEIHVSEGDETLLALQGSERVLTSG